MPKAHSCNLLCIFTLNATRTLQKQQFIQWILGFIFQHKKLRIFWASLLCAGIAHRRWSRRLSPAEWPLTQFSINICNEGDALVRQTSMFTAISGPTFLLQTFGRCLADFTFVRRYRRSAMVSSALSCERTTLGICYQYLRYNNGKPSENHNIYNECASPSTRRSSRACVKFTWTEINYALVYAKRYFLFASRFCFAAPVVSCTRDARFCQNIAPHRE